MVEVRLVDYWHPGSPVWEHYHSAAFVEERRKGLARIMTDWEKWLEEEAARGLLVDL